MLRKVGITFLKCFLALAIPPGFAEADPASSPIDPTLLTQIQATLDQDRKDADLELSKRRAELITISDPKERKAKEEHLNRIQKEFQDRFTALQTKIETDLVVGVSHQIQNTTTAPITSDSPNQKELAGFDLTVTPEELVLRDSKFKCFDSSIHQVDMNEVTLPIVLCQKKTTLVGYGEGAHRTESAFQFYQGKVFRFVTRIPKGVPYNSAAEQLGKKVGKKSKRVETAFIEEPSRYTARLLQGSQRIDGCGFNIDFLNGKAFVLVGDGSDYNDQNEIEKIDLHYRELTEKDDGCQNWLTPKEAQLIFYKSEPIEKKMTEDLERAVHDFKNANKSKFSL